MIKKRYQQMTKQKEKDKALVLLQQPHWPYLFFSSPSLLSRSMASLFSFSSLLQPKVSVSSPLRPKAVKTSISAPQTQTITEGLEEKFGRKGIKFSEPNMVELKVRNGSSLKLSLSDVHVVSYQPKVYWKDDGFEEVLYTVEDGNKTRGGVGLVIINEEEKASSVLSGCNWTVKDTDSDAIDAIQVRFGTT